MGFPLIGFTFVNQLLLPDRAPAVLMSKERPLISHPTLDRHYRPDLIPSSLVSSLLVIQIERHVVWCRPGLSVGPGMELFPMHDRIAYQGITFDDVLLEPGFSELPARARSILAPS